MKGRKKKECPFCNLAVDEKVIISTNKFFVKFDKNPVNEGHALIIPKRHVKPRHADMLLLDAAEWQDLPSAFRQAVKYLNPEFHPAGYNIGVNLGEAAGQTIAHLHFHLIPRYKGDVDNPRGGIRNFKKPLKEY